MAPSKLDKVTILTNNVGQSNHQSMGSFVDEVKPDVIVLQDAAYRLPAYRREYPGWYCEAKGEFVAISRFPISDAKLLTSPQWRGPMAAVFNIEEPDGRSFTVFSVHVPTPRPDFAQLRGHGFLRESIKGHSVPWNRFQEYKQAMIDRVGAVTALTQAIAAQKGPVIAAGDFNMPSWGYLHTVVSSKLCDSFEAAGSGFGFSFPGVTRNPISLFGPWLRIDYLFCNAGFRPVSAITESRRASQHRAVAATFEWVGH